MFPFFVFEQNLKNNIPIPTIEDKSKILINKNNAGDYILSFNLDQTDMLAEVILTYGDVLYPEKFSESSAKYISNDLMILYNSINDNFKSLSGNNLDSINNISNIDSDSVDFLGDLTKHLNEFEFFLQFATEHNLEITHRFC